jgi:hypothetical protein
LHLSQFARLCDLTTDQRKTLFEVVLGVGTAAYRKLISLFDRFQNLDSITQRAVIARLLTTVAQTLTDSKQIMTIDGYPLIPDDLQNLNEAKIYEIIVYNLLYRDKNIGTLSTSQRLIFLRSFAVYLQQPNRSPFATPFELRGLVGDLFVSEIGKSDTPEQQLEEFYRTCRRHSGLTTESQFYDNSGRIDLPVEDDDQESNVGFSHNSLREYLVADAIIDHLVNNKQYRGINSIIVSDVVASFVKFASISNPTISSSIKTTYKQANDSKLVEVLFKVILGFLKDNPSHVDMLGTPPLFNSLDLCNIDLSSLPLRDASFNDSILLDTDLRNADLRKASFRKSIIENVLLDKAFLNDTDFREAEINSIYVYDEYDLQTTSILKEKNARQWLYTRGALVTPSNDLNPLLGQPWYEAAREVAKTLVRKISGSHQDVSLAKGTKKHHREFANEFTSFLISSKILVKVEKSKTGPGYVVKLDKQYRKMITEFSENGKISVELGKFFDRHLKDR